MRSPGGSRPAHARRRWCRCRRSERAATGRCSARRTRRTPRSGRRLRAASASPRRRSPGRGARPSEPQWLRRRMDCEVGAQRRIVPCVLVCADRRDDALTFWRWQSEPLTYRGDILRRDDAGEHHSVDRRAVVVVLCIRRTFVPPTELEHCGQKRIGHQQSPGCAFVQHPDAADIEQHLRGG
ncbi:hypothetical protein ABW16_01970 [Mycolicibacter heraklionensis]|uniref:Uncharacterized protein n=1 Tax=Mycolicibacter heraklionensis TaxID=512402 RepID=A0ABR5FKU1_9MYCO|nr:hypothetical protein ABW16_01970 [Mycolicibacter heraklionensis]